MYIYIYIRGPNRVGGYSIIVSLVFRNGQPTEQLVFIPLRYSRTLVPRPAPVNVRHAVERDPGRISQQRYIFDVSYRRLWTSIAVKRL